MKKSKIIKIAAIAIGVLLLSVVAFAGGYYIYLDSKISSGVAGSLPSQVQTVSPDIENKEEVRNILLCGMVYQNEIEAKSEKGLTDVMIYLNLVTDKDGKVKGNILQIARDTYVGADESPNGRLNALYAGGPNQTDLIANLANQIYKDFKLPIDDYIVIDMDACKEIIDTMGGIDMYVPWDVEDNGKVVVPQGLHHIGGDTAEFIVRQRQSYATKDYKRLEMQQYFYKAVFNTLRNEFPASDAPKMANLAIHYSKTNMDLSSLMSLALKAINLKDEDIFILRMPGGALTVDMPFSSQPQSVYGINAEALAPLLNEHFRYGSQPVPASELGILTGFDYPLGETSDPGKYLSDIATEEE